MSHDKYKHMKELVDNYIASGMSAREYVESCVNSNDISAAEALMLLSILRDAQSITFKLNEISDDDIRGLQMILVRKEEDRCDSQPLFSIVINESLNHDREEVIGLLQKFAKELAVLATHGELDEAGDIDTIDDNIEDWLDHPSILPASETCH